MAEKKEPTKPATTAPPPSSAEAGTGNEKAPGNKKINKMTPAEIERKLNELRVSQGGLRSKYAQHLLKRKKILGS
jgi:hypothetical protein